MTFYIPFNVLKFFLYLKCIGTLSGEATLSFRGQLIKQKLCSPRSKFFSLRIILVLKELYCLENQTGPQGVASPLKMALKHGGVPIDLKSTLKGQKYAPYRVSTFLKN